MLGGRVLLGRAELGVVVWDSEREEVVILWNYCLYSINRTVPIPVSWVFILCSCLVS